MPRVTTHRDDRVRRRRRRILALAGALLAAAIAWALVKCPDEPVPAAQPAGGATATGSAAGATGGAGGDEPDSSTDRTSLSR